LKKLRIGIVGLGANTRSRHVPGLRACEGVEIAGVCNRSPESTAAAAAEFGIERTYSDWRQLIAAPDLDAVVIGTWPYLHCPITLAALAAGKHVLTEARMAMDAQQARQMLDASRQHPGLVTQIVPSPLGLRAHAHVRQLLAEGYLGQLREVVVLGVNSAVADAATPFHWRQDASLSGLNMLALGILHETLIRWIPDPIAVKAQTQIFTPERLDNQGRSRRVDTPDSVQVLTELPGGARGIYHLSGAVHFGPGMQIHLYGSEGTLKYDLGPADCLYGARHEEPALRPIEIPLDQQGGWRVEKEFVQAIRGEGIVEMTDFATGVRYMEFTEAVATSAKAAI
jgi:predicted dehydrogenase